MSERKAIETRIVQTDKGHFQLEALNGYVLLSDESATVCANVQDQLDQGITDDTECGEVAASILATFCSRRGNPLRRGAIVECSMGNGELVKGIVAYVRMGPPDYTKPEAVSVVLETKQNCPGYSGTMLPVRKVHVL